MPLLRCCVFLLFAIEMAGDIARITSTLDTHLRVSPRVNAAIDVKEEEEEDRDLQVEQCNSTTTCDFAALMPHDFDNDALRHACGFQAFPSFGTTSFLNVFNSSHVKQNIQSQSWRDDADLGSPNCNCNSNDPNGERGPGIGIGGIPNAAFSNCKALGNLLILQNPRVTDRPNADPHGGCLYIDFYDLYYEHGLDPFVVDFGLLDIEEGATINVRAQSEKNLDSETTSRRRRRRGSPLYMYTCISLF
jgi:hypothetical protein